MTRVLILTFPEDVHGVEVALALGDLGHEAVLWYGADFPTRQTASVRFGSDGVHWEARGRDLAVRPDGPPFDTVWFRRPSPPVLPEEALHPADRPMARRENEGFVSGLRHLVGGGAFEVNPLVTRGIADSKAVQLREALAAGLAIPPTLMSNDPQHIREFLDVHEGAAIYKPFYPAQWEAGSEPDDLVAVLATTEVSPDALPDDELVRLTPGIFQARVPKAHELRVTWMGKHAITAVLHSQESEATRVDWREGQTDLRVEPGELPGDVWKACHRLMERLGLVFGCFDLVVTPEGEHVFLEINPMGQFLWVEQTIPELPLLDDFCAFLIGARPGFRGTGRSPALRHEDFQERVEKHIEDALERHVPYRVSFVYDDRASKPDP